MPHDEEDEKELRSAISIRVEVKGEAEADLESILGEGNLPVEDGDEEEGHERLEAAIEGSEFQVELDGIPFTLRLHVG